MAKEYPLVRLKKTSTGEKFKGRKPHFPRRIPYERQAQRLGEVFQNTASALDDLAKGIDVASDPRAVIPERCLVFELIGPVQKFNVAAQALGLEWLLTEGIGESAEDDDSEAAEDSSELPPPKLLYLTMPSERALTRLLTQWKQYSKGWPAPNELRGLWDLFDYLHVLRPWSFEDRVDPALARYVDSVLADEPDRDVLVEIDLWYRTERDRRDRSIETLKEMLEEVGGALLDLVDLEEIRYQGALVRVPAEVARSLVSGEDGIASLNDVMTIRPQSAYESPIETDQSQIQGSPSLAAPSGPCLAAMLDGYPVTEHEALLGRVHIVEVDVTGENVPVMARFHGTAMASLILNGDMQLTGELPLGQKIVAIPVLGASKDLSREVTPEGKLPIGVIYRALRKIVEADPKQDPDLANVVVVNHSICDDYAPFIRRPSPWATLLDHFSHAHRLLFVVSAGNITSGFPLPDYINAAAFQAEPAEKKEAYLLAAIEQAKGTRGILSPAESINSLTVGAVHSDGAPPTAAATDPYPTHLMTNLASAVGLGVNRSVKPDLIEPGGRYVAGYSNVQNGGVQAHPRASAHYGQKVAAPSPIGELRRYIRTAGTSNAAALITRSSHYVATALDEAFAADKVKWRDLQTRVPMLKALLVHGCRWGAIGELLDATYQPRGPGMHARRRETITRFLGFGQADLTRVANGEANRITLIGEDCIQAGQRHGYKLPIPASMVNNREVRTITITLAWTCPTTHTTSDPRGVVLKLCGPDGSSSYWDGVSTEGRAQPSTAAGGRGTVIHVIHSGKKLIKNPDGTLSIYVQATSKVGFEKEKAPYAVAITLELAQQQRSQLYQQVLQAVRPRVRQTT
ncbi:S8 family peptidase [Chitinimonas sp. JJ19]|uniref:S8 family peptidase n=1 Tax=Chitinimonas sp. JJ19 TaxID=3109352 RepID=UPI003002F326